MESKLKRFIAEYKFQSPYEILYDMVYKYGYNEVLEALQEIAQHKGIAFCWRDGLLLYIDEYPNAIETPKRILHIDDGRQIVISSD